MKREHAAIIAKARRDGLKPVELASELMGYTLIESMRDCIASHAIAYKNMSQVQQDSCIQQMTEAVKEAIDLAIQTIASAGTRTVRMDLTSVAVGKKLKVAGVVAGTEEYKHDLIDLANDQGTAIVILNERDYLQGLDGIQGEKDQKSLPIDEDQEEKPAKGKKAPRVESPTSADALAKKATELPPKLLEDARAFIRDQQVCTVSGIQNGLKIGAVKATAVLDQMAAEGIVVFVGDEKKGEYKLNRVQADKATDESKPADNLSFDGSDESATTLTEELYEKIRANVETTKKVSPGAIGVTFDISEELVEEAMQRLEDDGVITEENDMGMRSVVEPE